MLVKRTKTPTVFSGAITLMALYGCSLQDYDYLGAENTKTNEDPTEEPDETTAEPSVDSSVEMPTTDVTTDVMSGPDASVTSDVIESEAGTPSTSDEQATSSTPSSEASTSSIAESTSAPQTSSVDETSTEPLPPLVVEGNLITNSSFESGVSPWIPFGNAVLIPSTEEAHTGESSLMCAGRNSGTYQSPSLPLLELLEAGKTYQLKVWVRMTASTSAGFSVTAKAPCIPDSGVIDTTNNANYIQLGSGLARKDGWREVTSTTFELPTCELSEYTIYFDGAPLGEDYYIDDVSLVEVTP